MNRAARYGVPLVIFCVAGLYGLQTVRTTSRFAAIAAVGVLWLVPFCAFDSSGNVSGVELPSQFVVQKYERLDRQVQSMSERRFELQQEHKVRPCHERLVRLCPAS